VSRFVLLDVNQALPKISQYLQDHPDDGTAPDEDEMKAMLRLALDYCWEETMLRLYSDVLTDRPKLELTGMREMALKITADEGITTDLESLTQTGRSRPSAARVHVGRIWT